VLGEQVAWLCSVPNDALDSDHAPTLLIRGRYPGFPGRGGRALHLLLDEDARKLAASSSPARLDRDEPLDERRLLEAACTAG